MAKTEQLRAQSDQELRARVPELRKSNFKLKNQIAMQSKEAKPQEVRANKKEIAQILTILRERELEKGSLG